MPRIQPATAVRGAHILLDSRARADSIYAEIESGRATFEDMARKHSLDEETAAEGAGLVRTMPSTGSQTECTSACSRWT